MHVLFYSIIKLRNESTCESDTQEHPGSADVREEKHMDPWFELRKRH